MVSGINKCSINGNHYYHHHCNKRKDVPEKSTSQNQRKWDHEERRPLETKGVKLAGRGRSMTRKGFAHGRGLQLQYAVLGP